MLLPLLASLSLTAMSPPPSVAPYAAVTPNPANGVHHFDVGDGNVVTVTMALSHPEGAVAVPLRLLGGIREVTVELCDSQACIAPQRVVVPAHDTVEVDAFVGDDGQPLLRVATPFERVCCRRGESPGRTIAFIGDSVDAAADVGHGNGQVVRLIPVGRLLDERRDQLGNVGAVVMRDGDLGHDDAFWAALRLFVQRGGLVSVDATQARHLALPPPSSIADVVASTRYAGGTFELRLGDARTLGAFTLFEPDQDSRTPATRVDDVVDGTLHLLDNGLVIVRPAGVGVVEAASSLVYARPQWLWRRGIDLRPDSNLARAVTVFVQPAFGAGTAFGVLAAIGALAFVVGLLARRRRLSAASVALVVSGVLVAGSVVVVVAARATDTVNHARLRIVGPGIGAHDDVVVDVRAGTTEVDVIPPAPYATRSFIAGNGWGHHRDRPRADNARIDIVTNVDGGGQHLLGEQGRFTNHTPWTLQVWHQPDRGGVVLAPGATGTPSTFTTLKLSPAIERVLGQLMSDCDCSVGVAVDTDDGVPVFVVETAR